MTRRSAILRGDTAALSVIRPEVLPIDHDALVSEHARSEREGRDAGYAAGLAEARADARAVSESASAAQASLLSALEAAIAEAHGVLETERHSLERSAAELAFRITEAVLTRELALSSSPGLEAIKRALAEAPETSGAVVRLNPADVEALGDASEIHDPETIVADPAVGAGGCVLEVGAAFVDARIESSLERVRKVLDEATKSP